MPLNGNEAEFPSKPNPKNKCKNQMLTSMSSINIIIIIIIIIIKTVRIANY